jgi:hypothetical protein
MRVCNLFAFLVLLQTVAPAIGASVIHVPADQLTIQAAINAASAGDTVLVSPGTYTEKINFNGKAITVKSSGGASVTTITSTSPGTIVTFQSGEVATSILEGFSIKGGVLTTGIFISSSPTILNNRITGNHSCDGAGIYIAAGAAIIRGNQISDNHHDQCSGGQGGGGILVSGQGSTQIIGNVISGNDGGNGFAGGGISLGGAGTALIMNNIIRNNTIGLWGGGLGISACCNNAIIVQNIFVGNSASDGAAVYSLPTPGTPVFVNNTFVNNKSDAGNSAVFINSAAQPSLFYNNIVVATQGQIAFFCGSINTLTLPVVISNDVYSPQGTNYGGACTDLTGSGGNISVDPQFVTKANYRLKGGSAAIDAGDNSAPNLPATDFAGNSRIIDGNGGPKAIVDIGAYEFVPVTLTPKSLNFGLQTVGSTSTKAVTLTNAQNRVLNVSSYTVPTAYSVSGCGSHVPIFASCTLTVTFHPQTTGTFKGSLIIKDDAATGTQAVSLSGRAR